MYCRKSHKTNYKDETGTKEKYSNKKQTKIFGKIYNSLYLKVLRQ